MDLLSVGQLGLVGLSVSRERELVSLMGSSLKEQCMREEDGCVCLHLLCLVLFAELTGSLLHLPGSHLHPLVSTLVDTTSQECAQVLVGSAPNTHNLRAIAQQAQRHVLAKPRAQ